MNTTNKISGLKYYSDLDNLIGRLMSKNIYMALIDNENNIFTIYKKNESDLFYPGSLVKLVTLFIIFKYKINMRESIVVEYSDIVIGSGNNLKSGDVITVNQLIKNMFFASSNTSASILKKIIENNLKISFKEIVSIVLSELGMSNTVIVNEHGLFDKLQKTTVVDMFKLMSTLLLDQNFIFFINRNLNKCKVSIKRSGDRVVVFKHKQIHENIIKTGSLFPNVFNTLFSGKIDGHVFIACLAYSPNKKTRENDIDFLNKIVEM